MIFIIIIAIILFIGRPLVFEHIEIFLKGLPPTQLWHPIMRIIFGIINSLFHYILMFLIIMYVIYLIIKLFIPNFPIPFKTILLSITPLKELQQAGIFRLFDEIIAALTSGGPILRVILRIISAIARFLASPFYMLRSLGTSKVIRIGGGSSSKKEKIDDTSAPPEETDGEPKYDNSMSILENIYLQKEYQQCINENYKAVTPDMADLDKQKVNVQNTTSKILCDIQKMQAYANIFSGKLEYAMEKAKSEF